MHWYEVEVLSFILIAAVLLSVLSALTFMVGLAEDLPEERPIPSDPISRSEFLTILDYFEFTTFEHVILCLKFLGEKEVDLDLREIYSLTDKGDGIMETHCLTVAMVTLLTDFNPPMLHLVRELERSYDDGTFTNALEVCEDVIASALPNYVMRFD